MHEKVLKDKYMDFHEKNEKFKKELVEIKKKIVKVDRKLQYKKIEADELLQELDQNNESQ